MIADLAFGGVGVGKIKTDEGSDFVIFVEGVVPGDEAKVILKRVKKNYAEAKLLEVIKPSAARITPRCRHFGICGGCSLQFLSYRDQLNWKEKMVRDALEKIGGFSQPPLEQIVGCSDPWFYRNKMEYSFSEPYLPRGQVGQKLGLHEKKSFSRIFDLQECFLQSPLSVEILYKVRDWAREKNLKAYDPRYGTGILKNLVVREGKNTGEVMVNLLTNGRDFSFDKEFVELICAAFPQVTSLFRTAVTVRKGFRTVVEEIHLAGKKSLAETLTVGENTLHFEIAPQAFFQPNSLQAQLLYGKVLESAAPKKQDTVLDLFCGTGTIGMFFASHVRQVSGMEINTSAIESARANASNNSIKNIEFLCRDISNFLSPQPSGLNPSILITDPPRAGLTPHALLKILALKVPRWIYVSCNPTTLARDLKIICENGYRLEKAQPVDMFPQTYHVESVALLTLQK